MKKIDKNQLSAFFNAVSEKMPLYLPVKKNGEVNYAKYDQTVETAIDALKTVKSAKDFFFPQTENMMKFKVEGKKIEVIDIREAQAPFVLFGVRACDYKAFSVLDNVFLQDPVDTYYKARRESSIIFTHACGKPEQSCFCATFGIDASEPTGDVTVWTDDKNAYFRANTEKGESVLALFDGFENDGEKEVAEIKERIKSAIEKLPYSHLDLSKFKPQNLNELFESDKWNEMSEACLGCGTCTFVCPTCQCFDIRDFKTDNNIIRFRCWDSCMYSDFTLMAGGNSRKTQMQRYRQRFMHKLVYYPSQYGMYSCVGCGRCVNKCPQHLNIIKVIKKLGGKEND